MEEVFHYFPRNLFFAVALHRKKVTQFGRAVPRKITMAYLFILRQILAGDDNNSYDVRSRSSGVTASNRACRRKMKAVPRLDWLIGFATNGRGNEIFRKKKTLGKTE
ncbi:hypothetical protein CEXT_567431 [Caerostris extrusa]|uniref:Uncharacterized protein n=1 Tax=Caerostris extrusa TaxID=172846 RepID=A0AAV4T8G4_CAEEX|nr:hypothetical protein CEXT_567431 [Caerostris extrusa]